MGVISPVGLEVPTVWQNLVAGRSGIRPITLFDTSQHDVCIAGEVADFDPTDYMAAKEARRNDRGTQFALAAAQQALVQSHLKLDENNALQVGVILGTGMAGIWTYTRELEVMREKGPRSVSPFLIPAITADSGAVQLALRTGAQGPNLGVSSACATSADAIGWAFETIVRGHAEVMITGGYEAAVTPVGIAAFDRMRALSHRNDDPPAASRPFDAERDGFVMGEGGAILVLEELEYALSRGAEPLAEVLSYAATCDATHLTAPDPAGTNAAHCIRLALQRANIAPADVSYINAHGTSTPAGDPAETQAIKLALGEHAYRVAISSTKSMTGHLLGGAAALETVVCVQALRTGIVPPTINLQNPDPACDLDYVPNVAREAQPEIALSNSFGFGGHNAALLFKRYA